MRCRPRRSTRMLKALFGAERHWVARRSLPFGVSLAVVAERMA